MQTSSIQVYFFDNSDFQKKKLKYHLFSLRLKLNYDYDLKWTVKLQEGGTGDNEDSVRTTIILTTCRVR